MSEYTENKVGQIQIADEVIAIIAATAAGEVEGVVTSATVSNESFVGRFGKKNLAKGVKVSIEEGEATIEISIAVKMGIHILQAAKEVQTKVKDAVETMTGLHVSTVNVNIDAVLVEKVRHTKEEEEA